MVDLFLRIGNGWISSQLCLFTRGYIQRQERDVHEFEPGRQGALILGCPWSMVLSDRIVTPIFSRL